MSNRLYQEMMGRTNTDNPAQVIDQLMHDPINFALKYGFRIPNNIARNPNSIIQYLLNSGQISQETYNRKYNQFAQIVRNMNSF